MSLDDIWSAKYAQDIKKRTINVYLVATSIMCLSMRYSNDQAFVAPSLARRYYRPWQLSIIDGPLLTAYLSMTISSCAVIPSGRPI